MSNNSQKPSLREKANRYNHTVRELIVSFVLTNRLIIAIILLVLIPLGVYRSCNKSSEPPPTTTSENPAIKELYSYLSCIDKGLISMESNTTDENLKIAIKNFKEYKQVAIDMPAFKKYENPKEALSKKEKEKLKSYILTIKADLESNAKVFSIQLPDCK